MVVCVNLLFAAGHITEAASKHQIHLFVRFVIAILLCSRVLNASHNDRTSSDWSTRQ